MEKEQGYIKKTITFLVPTHLGDRYLNKDECLFLEAKSNGDTVVVVEEKIKESNNANRDIQKEK